LSSFAKLPDLNDSTDEDRLTNDEFLILIKPISLV